MMADVHGSPASDGSQMPQAGSGPAPVPYAGPDRGAGIITYAATGVAWQMPSAEVMNGYPASTPALQESGYAHDVNAGLVNPYYPGAISPIMVGGDADAGGRDIVSGTVAGAVDNRVAYYTELEGDSHPQGSVMGDLMPLPPGPLDPGTVAGVADPSGSYYDPPRSY